MYCTPGSFWSRVFCVKLESTKGGVTDGYNHVFDGKRLGFRPRGHDLGVFYLMAPLRKFNPNPYGSKVGDCVIRAICAATGQAWNTTYTGVTLQGYALKDMPSSNYVWGEYLKKEDQKERGGRRCLIHSVA